MPEIGLPLKWKLLFIFIKDLIDYTSTITRKKSPTDTPPYTNWAQGVQGALGAVQDASKSDRT